MKNFNIIATAFVLALLTFNSSYASMRRCMLLPIKDSVGGAIGFKVFEKVENYLLDSDWCYYRSNSEILNILGNYKKNLDEYLKSPDVLKVIANKTRSGSIISVAMVSKVNGLKLSIKIFGKNGQDLLFAEEADHKSEDPAVISRTIINWLNIYEKNIPYHGLVSGVMGNQFTADIGVEFGAVPGQFIEIIRATEKKKHPLFKEIVDFDTLKIGEGKLSHVTKSLSNGKIFKYDSFKRLKIGDWVILKKKNPKIENMMDSKYKKSNPNSFGKLGKVGFFLNLGSGSDSSTAEGESTKRIGGLLIGAHIWGELWATRNYLLSLDVSRKFGSFKKKEGDVLSEKNTTSNGVFKMKFGYRYLPLGFFYGPRINGYIGYAKYDYGLDNQLSDGFTGVSFSGPLLGAKGSLPILRKYRLFMVFDFMLKSKFEEDVLLYGEDDSSTNYHFELGGEYRYLPNINLLGSIGYDSNKAKFVSPQRVLALSETILKFGVTLNF